MVEAFKSKPPKNMADVANVYGKLIESVETEWRQFQKANTDATALPEPKRNRSGVPCMRRIFRPQ